MNPPKVSEQDDINCLIATPKVCSATDAARVQPEQSMAPAHDAFPRLLHRLEPDAATRWHEAAEHVDQHSGILGVEDSTLDKPYAKRIGLVQRHGSGKHHAVVDGINLISLLWPDGDRHVPVDSRLDDKAGEGLNQDDHFQALLEGA